jgi:hypothetical protein
VKQIDQEHVLTRVAELPRPKLIQYLLEGRMDFPSDFTLEFLDKQTTDRLRHLVLAAALHGLRLESPESPIL